MLQQTIKSAEKTVADLADRTLNSATQVASQLRSGLADAAEGTAAALKADVNQVSRATREAASSVSAEVVRRPLTYTLAAAGAGALVGLGLMAVLNRSRSTSR